MGEISPRFLIYKAIYGGVVFCWWFFYRFAPMVLPPFGSKYFLGHFCPSTKATQI